MCCFSISPLLLNSSFLENITLGGWEGHLSLPTHD
jgi:hypothetical protein